MEVTEQMNGDNARKADHLCVLVHGLWGNPAHLAQVASALRSRHSETTLRILVAESNAGTFTYDGIELGGERVTKEIEDSLEKLSNEGQRIRKLSIVGYSLGGLIARYAIGLLFSKGWFENLEPVNFTTFATPHLGVRTPLRGWHNHLWNVLGARTLSTSGRQLFLIDSFRETGRPLLAVLADPNSIFIRGLSRFRNRCLYANIVNDRSAVYYTTAISPVDPYTDLEKIKLNYEEGYDSVIVNSNNMLTLDNEGTSRALINRISAGGGTAIRGIPIVALLAVAIPIGSVVFLVNSGIQSFRSQKRIRLHEEGKAGIGIGSYRIPLILQEARSVMEGAYEGMNRRQSQEYLPAGEESRRRERQGSISSLRQSNGLAGSNLDDQINAITEEPEEDHIVESEKTSKTSGGPQSGKEQPDFPTLALTDEQFAMIETLDAVGFRKHPVHIHKVRHSHAAIIQRRVAKGYDEGRIVLRHWLDKEFKV
ncbi:MAG: hypothetical protein M1835_005535 [Candelina submexicana]|nr:MAG: hypothetical protein M1835_005535 [Candelina submexicana]